MSIKDREYTTQEIADIIGHTIHKTISYVNRGYIKPSIQDSHGHGSKRLWSYNDVIRMLIIRHLEDWGVRVDRIREICVDMEDMHLAINRFWAIPPKGDVVSLDFTIDGEVCPEFLASGEDLFEKLEFDENPMQMLVILSRFHKIAKEQATKFSIV